MNALPVALSLTSTFTKVGAIAGFAALVGIAMLSLLAFSQAREIKRLREWAGRAPERASELEQRVSTEAAARMQRAGQPAAPPGARVLPRKTPLVSAPVSTAVNATVAAGKIGVPPAPGTPLAPGVQSTPEAQPRTPVPAPAGEAVPESPQGIPVTALEGAVGVSTNGEVSGELEQVSAMESVSPIDGPAGPGAKPGQPPVQPLGEPGQGEPEDGEEGQPAPAPATAAARAAAPRPALPPSPSAPAPPGAAGSPASASGASALPASADASAAAQSAPSTSPSPAPVAAARRTPSRTVAGPAAGGSQPRSPSPRGANVASTAAAVAGGGASTRPPGSPLSSSGPKYFKPERSAGRATALIVGGVIVAVLVIVLAVTELKGGKSNSPATQSSSSSIATHSTASHGTTHAKASNPGEMMVVVLNGTSTNGLAHHLAADLQQGGYTHAESSAAVPPGTHATTVVEYTRGHRADGVAVAKALDVTRVRPIEASTASLASSATVVVLAGADQATQLGGGGAQSKGEPAAGAAGEAGTGEADAGAGGAGEGAAGSGQ